MPSGRRVPLPPKDDPQKIKHFLDTVITNDNSYRIERFSVWERARLYTKINQQWNEPDYTEDPTRTPFWQPLQLNEQNWMPLPVHNEMVAPIQNEVARLQGNGSRPRVAPKDDSPKNQRAAKIGTDALNSKLREFQWREMEHEGTDDCVTYGTWILKGTGWDIDYTKMFRAPVTTAHRCSDPSCSFRLASRAVPNNRTLDVMSDPSNEGRLSVSSMADPNNEMMPAKYRAHVTHCLTCQPDPGADAVVDPVTFEELSPARPPKPVPPMEPYVPEKEEAKQGKDHFGRPLGQDVPLGDVGLKNVSLFDFHPENQGLDRRPRELNEFAEERIETLDWVANHYPDKVHLVEAASAVDIMRWHPIVGGSKHIYGSLGSDPDLFSNHCFVREWHKKPWYEGGKLNRGRSIIMAGDVVLLDGDYMIESDKEPGKLLARVHYEIIPWEVRTKEVFGLSMSELLFSYQDSINTLISQVQDARLRFGSPKLLCEEGMDIRYAGFSDTGYDSDVYYYQPGTEGAEPKPFANVQMNTEWANEYKIYVESIQRTSGTMDSEIGNPTGEITAASAYMYLGEKAAERRKHRIDRIREAKKRIYKFLLEWIQERYDEEREYNVQTSADRRAQRAFTGADICNQTDVELDDEPAFDTRTARRAAVVEAMNRGTIIADTAAAKRKINRELGAPNDINEDANAQVERAQDEWLAYFEDGKVPAVNERGDTHLIHFQQHQLDLMGRDAQSLMDEVEWNQVELAIWGWREDYAAIVAAEAMLKAAPPGAAPPMLADPAGNPAPPEAQAQAAQIWQQQIEQQAYIQSLPRAPELRIEQFMKAALEKSGILLTNEPDPLNPMVMVQKRDTVREEGILQLFRFIAHTEAHWFLHGQQMMGGAGMPAPPGGMETATGTMPGPGQAATPGAGSGPTSATASGSGVAAAA